MPSRVAVLGAGTMGAGIAQVALQAGHSVWLYDIAEAVLARGRGAIEGGLAKLVEKGKLEATARDAALGRFVCTSALADLTDADVVIEAVPEVLALKRELFSYLGEHGRPDALLASNTSSLSITAIATGIRHPERVVGLHFFNPAPLMALVEVIQGAQTGATALEAARAFTLGLGKLPVMCLDTPGFIVNRVARPFYGEALKILGEGGASAGAIDAAARAGGFRMGPFELMDLIGIDVNFAVTQSVYQAFFNEARFRPHPIQQRLVAAGRLGRKTGRGFYGYGDQAEALSSPMHPVGAAPTWQVAVVGEPRDLARWGPRVVAAGHGLLAIDTSGSFPPAELVPDLAGCQLVLEVGTKASSAERDALHARIAEQVAPATWLVTTDLARTATALRAACGLPAMVLSDWSGDGPWEVAVADGAPDATPVLDLLAGLGAGVIPVADHLGLVLARLVSMLANEAAFALQEGVSDAPDIDLAMKLGANYPQGPLAWADRLGAARIVTLLDALRQELGEERYRVAPLMRRHALAGQLFHALTEVATAP